MFGTEFAGGAKGAYLKVDKPEAFKKAFEGLIKPSNAARFIMIHRLRSYFETFAPIGMLLAEARLARY